VADTREDLLARLVLVCGAVAGVRAVGRNTLDVADLNRPAVIVQDGIEQMRDIANGARYSEVGRMELSPSVTVFLRAGIGVDPGRLMSLYRSRVVAAVLTAAELIAATGRNGGIRYEGCVALPPDAETKEHRLDLHFVFAYPFRLSDVAAEVPLTVPVRVEHPASGATIVMQGGESALYVATGPLDALTVRLPPSFPAGEPFEVSFAAPVSDLMVRDSDGASTVTGAPTSGYGPGSALQFRYVDAVVGWVYWG